MEASLLLVAASGLFLAGIVKGSTGLGYASCALPFLVASLGLKPAMALVIVPAMATNIGVAFTAGHFKETVQRFTWLYAAMLPGIGVGIALLLWVSQSMAVRTLGLLIVAYVAFTATKPNLRLPSHLEMRLQIPTGFLNGVLTGLTGSQVLPLFPYIMSLGLDSARMVQAINLAVMIASATLAAGLMATGILTGEMFFWSLAAIGPALVGVYLGTLARDRIPDRQFRYLVLTVLLVTGVSMITR